MSREKNFRENERHNSLEEGSSSIISEPSSDLASLRQSFLVEEFLDFQTVSKGGLEAEGYRRQPGVNNNEIPEIADTTCCGAVAIIPKRVRNIDISERIIKKIQISWMSFFSTCAAFFMVLVIYGTACMLLGNLMDPGQPFFDIYILYVCAYIVGWSLTFIPRLHLPPTLGMILVGLLARNIEINGQPMYDISTNLSPKSAVMLRNFCLIFIMMRCGLQMNATTIKERKAIILMIAFIPSTVEMCVLAYIGKSILNYPWAWAFLAGAICATTSPVVTGHCVLSLEEKGYGGSTSHILCASTAIDSTQIVTMYSIFVAFVLGDFILVTFFYKILINLMRIKFWNKYDGAEDQHSIVMEGLRTIAVNMTIGVFSGIGLGILCTFIPHRGQTHVYRYRVLAITLASFFMSTLGVYMEVLGGAFLATIVLCFVASAGWRMISTNFNSHPIRTFVNFIWHFSQPLIMSTVSAEIHLKSWDPNRVLKHFLCISLGVISRCIAAFTITKGQNFDQKERSFISLGTIPKGTVQAALAPIAAERCLEKLDDLNKNLTALIKTLMTTMTREEAVVIGKYQLNYDKRVDKLMQRIATARDMMNMSLLSIIILAPLGAFLLMTMGPHLLRRTSKSG